MCGITGIYAFNMVGRVSMVNTANATAALALRGPDFQDIYHDQTVALGHRRLSVIDPTPGGHQPMWDAHRRYCIVFNGEIYNYAALKKQLLADGVTFRSETDTEVLLQLYIKEGVSCLQKLNGFFAFAIYDSRQKSLFIARDRLGIKPLYYLHDGDRLLFASEMKALPEYGIDKSLNYTALHTYLQINYIPAPQTMFQHVSKLMPGHYILAESGGVSVDRYYEIPYDRGHTIAYGYEEQKKEFARLLEASVHKRLVADVPLGAFLSGGIDSSVIATLAKRHKSDLHTFSIGFKDEPFFDETRYARAVAHKIGSDHTVFSLTNADLYEHVDAILDYMDEPFADSSAIAVYILSQETRKYATVALSGDGADELFAGYNKHAAFRRILHPDAATRAVKALRALWYLLPKSRNSSLTNKFRQLHRFAQGMSMGSKARYWAWAGFASEGQSLRLLSAGSQSRLDLAAYEQAKADLLKYIPEKETMADLLYADMHLVLPDDMLTKVDRMSMANALEVRVPFLDHELVAFAFSLPEDAKINGSMRKRIVQDTFRDMLPAELYNRPKKGFEVPLLKWFRTEMRHTIENDLLSDRFVEEQGIFNTDEVRKLKRKLYSRNPGDVHARIWGLIVFQRWWKKYGE